MNSGGSLYRPAHVGPLVAACTQDKCCPCGAGAPCPIAASEPPCRVTDPVEASEPTSHGRQGLPWGERGLVAAEDKRGCGGGGGLLCVSRICLLACCLLVQFIPLLLLLSSNPQNAPTPTCVEGGHHWVRPTPEFQAGAGAGAGGGAHFPL